jgi:glycosyltransferase involved in cell wall biosynthesis
MDPVCIENEGAGVHLLSTRPDCPKMGVWGVPTCKAHPILRESHSAAAPSRQSTLKNTNDRFEHMDASRGASKKDYSVLHLIDIFDVRYERDQQRIVSVQAERGYNVTVVTSTYNDEWRRNQRSSFEKWEANFKGIDIHHNAAVKLPFFKTVVYVPGARAFGHYDIIHAYGPWSYSSYLSCILKKVTKVPVVMRADFPEGAYQTAKRSRFWRSLLRAQFTSADAITAFTTAEKRYLTDLGIGGDKIWVIPMGVNLSKFRTAANRARAQNEIVIGYIGRFAPLKGVHRLVSPLSKILQEYENAEVIFAGPQHDRAYFNHIMNEMKQYTNFSYLGILRDSITFFKQCDIVIMPGMREAGAITAKEAMAAGKAVVAFNVYPFNSYLTNEVSGLLVDTEADLYNGCKRLIEDPDLLERLQKGALSQSPDFGDRQMVDKIEEMYDYVLDQR